MNYRLIMSKLFKILLLILAGTVNYTNAQFGFSHELGVITGPVAFQSDYGERNDFSTDLGNTGFGIGLVHYLNFAYKADCSCYTPETYFNDHFKLRSEISFSKTNLEHFGQWVTDEKVAKSIDAAQLKAMTGSTSVTNVGMQLEFYPWSIRNFTASTGGWGPYISLGGHFNFYSPSVSTSYGDGKLNNAANIHPKYWAPSEGEAHGFSAKSGTTWSIVSSAGTRYKLTPLSDLLVDLRFQYYFSNWVDGLNPNPSKYPENKHNDWLVWLNFGYIYYLD